MKIVELDTGLFPDAPRVAEALATLEETSDITRLDAGALDPKDDTAWAEIASALLGADKIVTL